uniref:VHS domain-containing protein n=1 Tax=Trichuris muris TaxID=70415 RepID=A0A5S6QP02_TRIMR
MQQTPTSSQATDPLVGTLWRLCHGKKPMHEHDLLNAETMCEDSQESSAAACKYLLHALSKAPKSASKRALETMDILFMKSHRFREEVVGSVLLLVKRTIGNPVRKGGHDGRANHARLESLAMPIFRKWIDLFGDSHGKLLSLEQYLDACSAKCSSSSQPVEQGCSQVPDFRTQNAILKAQIVERSRQKFDELYSKVKPAVVSLDNAMKLLVPSVELGERSSTTSSSPRSGATVVNTLPVTVTLQLGRTEVPKNADNHDLIKYATGLHQQIRTSYRSALNDMIAELRRSRCTHDLCSRAEQLLSEMTLVGNKFSEVDFVSDSDFASDSDFEDVVSNCSN